MVWLTIATFWALTLSAWEQAQGSEARWKAWQLNYAHELNVVSPPEMNTHLGTPKILR